MDMVSVTGR